MSDTAPLFVDEQIANGEAALRIAERDYEARPTEGNKNRVDWYRGWLQAARDYKASVRH